MTEMKIFISENEMMKIKQKFDIYCVWI